MVVSYYNNLFCTGADRHNDILMSLLLLVAEAINFVNFLVLSLNNFFLVLSFLVLSLNLSAWGPTDTTVF